MRPKIVAIIKIHLEFLPGKVIFLVWPVIFYKVFINWFPSSIYVCIFTSVEKIFKMYDIRTAKCGSVTCTGFLGFLRTDDPSRSGWGIFLISQEDSLMPSKLHCSHFCHLNWILPPEYISSASKCVLKQLGSNKVIVSRFLDQNVSLHCLISLEDSGAH